MDARVADGRERAGHVDVCLGVHVDDMDAHIGERLDVAAGNLGHHVNVAGDGGVLGDPVYVLEPHPVVGDFKIDKVTVWDGGAGGGNSISGLVRDYATSLPPLQDLLKMTGVIGPGLLGRREEEKPPHRPAPGSADKAQ